METLLERLLESPKLSLYVEQMQQILQEERKRREEFYNTITDDVKAEFINGEIVYHSPVKLVHNHAAKLLLKLVDTYVQKHRLGFVGYEKLMISLTRNDYEPDICFFGKEKAAQFAPDQSRFPAPDFIAEVLSDTTDSRDRGVKFIDYAAHGVQEYWLVDTDCRLVEQYLLHGEEYKLSQTITSGMVESAVIRGCAIPLAAIFDETENLKALQQILLG